MDMQQMPVISMAIISYIAQYFKFIAKGNEKLLLIKVIKDNAKTTRPKVQEYIRELFSKDDVIEDMKTRYGDQLDDPDTTWGKVYSHALLAKSAFDFMHSPPKAGYIDLINHLGLNSDNLVVTVLAPRVKTIFEHRGEQLWRVVEGFESNAPKFMVSPIENGYGDLHIYWGGGVTEPKTLSYIPLNRDSASYEFTKTGQELPEAKFAPLQMITTICYIEPQGDIPGGVRVLGVIPPKMAMADTQEVGLFSEFQTANVVNEIVSRCQCIASGLGS